MPKHISYKTSGTCSKEINIKIKNEIIESVEFRGGCPGNLIGIKRLVEGRSVDEVISCVEGVKCGSRSTSCPDQLANALKSYREAG